MFSKCLRPELSWSVKEKTSRNKIVSTERLVVPQVNMNSDRFLDEKVNSFKNT